MDGTQFDRITARLAATAPRRVVLGGLGGLLGLEAAAARTAAKNNKKKKKRKKCKAPRVRCGKQCLAAGACCTNADCPIGGQTCVRNGCECPAGQVVDDGACTVPCIPACGVCQRCSGGACLNLPNGSACPQGKCRDGVCKPDRSFGCVTSQNQCVETAVIPCPGNNTAGARCFVDPDGDSVCGTGTCTSNTSQAACITASGPDAFVVPCAICALGGATHMCVKPVSA